MACKTCDQDRAELLGIIADLSIHVVSLQAQLDPAQNCSSPILSGSLTLHSDHRTNKFGHSYRVRHNLLNVDDDGYDQFVDICPTCEGVDICICSDEEQLAVLLPHPAKSTTRSAAATKPKQTRGRGKCTVTQQTNTSNRVSCEFCFNKTGKQFSHPQIDCFRKKKFSKKVECHKKSEKKLSKNM